MTLADALSTFPRERTWLLPALQAAQRVARWLSPETLEAVAAHVRVPKSEVWGVASHYPEFRLAQPARRIVRVCTGLACAARGGNELLAQAVRRLETPPGAAEVTLEPMDCAFACAVAPVVEADHAYHGRLTPAALDALLDAPAALEMPPPATGRGGPPATMPSVGSPGARFTALKREAERRRTGARLAVGVGTCGLAVGAAETLEALRTESQRRGLAWTVVAAGCNGMCWAAPVVQALRDGKPPVTAGPITADSVPRFLHALSAAMQRDFTVAEDWAAPQQRILMERCGVADPYDIADALRHGAYETFARALEDGRAETIIDEVRASGLAGRGGAYFQTAVKWAACRAASGAPKFLVVNGEEGEPGIFKDRHLMEGDPHRLLEAVLLAAYAADASRAILYIHGEAELSAQRVAAALEQARQWGLVGDEILGSPFSLDVQIRRGAGGFVLGEETALLESIEGRRAMPRTRPPFPVEAGLYGKPTVINNVETLFAVVPIVGRGGAWFATLGGGRGTKLFGLSGHLRRPGVVEMEVGGTLRTLVDDVGGGWERPIGAAVVGGPSGSIVHPRQFDEPLVPRGPVNPGTGGVVALEEGASVREAVRTLLAFNARESCGKCTPCREGTARMLALLDDKTVDTARMKTLSETVQLASLCGLGQAAPLAVLTGLTEFPEQFGIMNHP
ncbi:MAG TPA: NAD(P)H-dependent oxidoreductase subunit E [Methylomirabilota bacterium]|nr:NAD(P)H-dependent oxidoreductase subunit E [Methylomirabilota bacterium]